MLFPRTPLRRALAALACGSAAVTLAAVTTGTGHAVPGPINAGNTYGWYRNPMTKYDFESRMGPYWHRHGNGVVRDQHGMLTLNTTRHGDVSATLDRAGHAYGRWEIRLRSRRYESRHRNFRVVTELIPAGRRRQHCGGNEIGLENYQLGRREAKFYIHRLPDRDFRAFKPMSLANDQWHTFAIEATRTHISWFVDAHVVRTERRPAALADTPLTVRFTMRAIPGQTMNRSRMQMDWLRYFGDRYPSTRSLSAPGTRLSTYRRAC
jgi:hypothetical protein